MSDELNGWPYDKRYVEGQLKDLKASQAAQSSMLERVEAKLTEIETELRAYKRAAQFLIALGSAVGVVLGWFAKAMGKG